MRWILDVTGFTVHAVLCVDLKTRAITLLDNFVYPSRAVALGWLSIHGQVIAHRHLSIFERQVTGLVFLMVGIG